MVRSYKDTEETVRSRTMVEIKCDLCGKKARNDCWDKGSMYDVNETEVSVVVRQKGGSNSPEGGSGTEYVIDLCPACFKNRLVKWLVSEGATVAEMEWDW